MGNAFVSQCPLEGHSLGLGYEFVTTQPQDSCKQITVFPVP